VPIREDRKRLYPENWPAISAMVRAEADYRCEQCRVPNATVGYRRLDGSFAGVPAIDRPTVERVLRDLRGPVARLTRIVLTVHHRDGDPTNNRRDNLVALCQRCHLAADRELRGASRAADSPALWETSPVGVAARQAFRDHYLGQTRGDGCAAPAPGATIDNVIGPLFDITETVQEAERFLESLPKKGDPK
jgi:5-methylcytosine-specific restriction endonuclease McrA